jgi:YggT family protein
MFILGNILVGLAQALSGALQVYTFVLIGRAIVSWVDADPRNTIVRILILATEPPSHVIRRLLPPACATSRWTSPSLSCSGS